MTAAVKRGGAALAAVLTALVMVMALASGASAHNSKDADGTGTNAVFVCSTEDDSGATTQTHDHRLLHDDQHGVACNAAGSANGVPAHSESHPGTGDVDDVANDAPSDAVVVIRDYGLENAPIIVGVIGAIFLVGLTFYLIRRGLMKARGAMRL